MTKRKIFLIIVISISIALAIKTYEIKKNSKIVDLSLCEDLNERKEHIRQMETKISELAQKRKTRSEHILKKLNVPINIYLPYIEDENEVLIQEKNETANRILVLLVVALKAEGLDQKKVTSIIKDYELEEYIT